MARRLISPASESELAQLERVFGYQRQRDILRERNLSRRHDDAPGVSGDQALSVLEKSLIVRTSESRAIQVYTTDGHRQLTIGTEDEADGGEPFLTISEDHDVGGYRARIHGRLGHYTAPAGIMMTRDAHFARRRAQALWHPASSAILVDGTSAWTADTPANGETTTDPWASWTTAASVGNARGPNGAADFAPAWLAESFFRIQMGSSIANQRVWVGLFDGDPSGSSTPNLNFSGFRYHAGTDTNWLAYTGDGSNRTNVDTGIVVATNQAYNFTVRAYPTFSQMIIGLPEFDDGFMNGTQTNTITATLPNSATRIASYIRITNITSAQAVNIKWSHSTFVYGAAWFD